MVPDRESYINCETDEEGSQEKNNWKERKTRGTTNKPILGGSLHKLVERKPNKKSRKRRKRGGDLEKCERYVF